MNTWACGDIHGAHKALVQCLERSGFNKKVDRLIQMGDICDGYSQVYECVEELLTVENRVLLLGNHDLPFIQFINTGFHEWQWAQGGEGTLKSYAAHSDVEIKISTRYNDGKPIYISNLSTPDIPDTHKRFFKEMRYYFKDEHDNLFVHGGFERSVLLKDQHKDNFLWDRSLWRKALSSKNGLFKIEEPVNHVFIGHTTTLNWGKDVPMKAVNVWNLDTGAGFEGKLTFMNVDTHEYVQSDNVEELYPDDKGRRN